MNTVNRGKKILDEEIKLNHKKYIVSKTDLRGVITYGNDYFTEISGYKESELVGQPHNILRHPDMPRVIFKHVWDSISIGQPIMGIIKNRAKDGRYYWIVSEFEPKRDKLDNKIIGYNAFRKAATEKAVKAIEPIYAKLLEIEKVSGIKGSGDYLAGFLEEQGKTYDEFINELVGNKGMFKIFFRAMKKIFS